MVYVESKVENTYIQEMRRIETIALYRENETVFLGSKLTWSCQRQYNNGYLTNSNQLEVIQIKKENFTSSSLRKKCLAQSNTIVRSTQKIFTLRSF